MVYSSFCFSLALSYHTIIFAPPSFPLPSSCSSTDWNESHLQHWCNHGKRRIVQVRYPGLELCHFSQSIRYVVAYLLTIRRSPSPRPTDQPSLLWLQNIDLCGDVVLFGRKPECQVSHTYHHTIPCHTIPYPLYICLCAFQQ
jgi:hypothetical protein